MEGSYSRPDGRGQPSMPTDRPTDPAYQVNVSRQKTKKWVEAKTQNYDGDDWGADEYEDEKELPRNQAPLPPLPGAQAAVTTQHLPSQVPNPRSLQVRTQHQDQASLRTASPAVSDVSANLTPPASERMVSPPSAGVPFAQPPHGPPPAGAATGTTGPSSAPQGAPPNKPNFIRPSEIYRRMEQAKNNAAEQSEAKRSSASSAGSAGPQSRPIHSQPPPAANPGPGGPGPATFQTPPRGESMQPPARAPQSSFQTPPRGESLPPPPNPTHREPASQSSRVQSLPQQQQPSIAHQPALSSFQTPPRGQSLPQYGNNGSQAQPPAQQPPHSGAPQFLSHPTNDRSLSTSPKLPDLARMSVFGADDFFSSTTSSFMNEPLPETPDLTKFATTAKQTPAEPAEEKKSVQDAPAPVASVPEPAASKPTEKEIEPSAAAPPAAPSEPVKTSPQLLPVDTSVSPAAHQAVTDDKDDAAKQRESPKAHEQPALSDITTPVSATAPTQSVEVTPTQPLQVRKGESPVLEPPPPMQRTGTFNTDTSSPVKESDVLRDEIIRTLSPVADPRIESLAERESQERNKVRDSSYTLSDYDTYWADSAPPSDAAAAGAVAGGADPKAHVTPLGLTKSHEQAPPSAAPVPTPAVAPISAAAPIVAEAAHVPPPAQAQEHIEAAPVSAPPVATAAPVATATVAAPTADALVPETPVAETPNQRQVRRRFSWEAAEESLAPPKQAPPQQATGTPVATTTLAATAAGAAAAAGAAVVAGTVANKAGAAHPTEESKPQPVAAPIVDDGKAAEATKDASSVPGINVVSDAKPATVPEPATAAPVDQAEEDSQKRVSGAADDVDNKSVAGSRLSRLSLADEKALTETSSRVVPESPPMADHPALSEPSAGWVPQVLPPVAHPVSAAQTKSFREIMELGTPKERIASFNETRVSYATTDSGLDQWLTVLRTDHPEHLTKSTALAYVPASGPPGPASGAQQQSTQQPYYQQYLNATTSSPTTTRTRLGGLSIPTGNTTSSFSHSSNQIGTKSKEFMQSAGKMGLGLLSKGKIKLRGSGEKADSPSSPAPKAKPDRRTSWAVNISPKRKADVPPPVVQVQQQPQHQYQHAPSASISSRLAPQIPQPEPLSPIEPSAVDPNDPWAAAAAAAAADAQSESVKAADKDEVAPAVPSKSPVVAGPSSNDDWASVTRDMAKPAPAAAPHTFAAQDSGVAMQSSQTTEDTTPRDASFIGLPPIRRSSTFALSKAKKTKEIKERFLLDDDDVSLPEHSVASQLIAENTAAEPDISDDNESAATSGKQVPAAPLAENTKAAVQVPPANNVPLAPLDVPSNEIVQPKDNVMAPASAEPKHPEPSYPNGNGIPPPNHAPMMMPNQRFAGAGPWKLEESYLAEPLNQVSRNRSGTGGSRSPAFPGFDGRAGFPGPQGPDYGGPNQPRPQDMPPSSAQRYPGLFAPTDQGMPHPGQGAGWRGDGPNPRGASSEFGIAGMGPPAPEERGRSKRSSGIFKDIGGKLARATSRDRFSSNADGRLSRTNTRDEFGTGDSESFQDNKKRRSSFMMNLGGRRGSMDQSRPQDSFGPPKRSATDMSFGTEDSQGRRKSIMNTLAAAQNKFLPSTGSRLSMSMSRPEHEDEATTPKKKRFSDMTKLFRKSKNTDGSERPPSRNALSTFSSSQQDSRPGSNDWAGPRQRSGTLGSMEPGDGATTPRGRGSGMANFFARRSGSRQRTGDAADANRQFQTAQQGPQDSSIHTQNWQNIPRPPSQQRGDASIPTNRSLNNSNRNSADVDPRRASQLWMQHPTTASPLGYGIPAPAGLKHADVDAGVRQSLSSERGDPSADTLEGSTLQTPHQGLTIPDLEGTGKRPMSADDDARTERGEQDTREPEPQERRESEAAAMPTESRPSITSIASSMISRQDTNDSTSDVADTTISRMSAASPPNTQVPPQEQTPAPVQAPITQHAANFDPSFGTNEPVAPSGWNRAEQPHQPPTAPAAAGPGYSQMRVDQYGRPMGSVPGPVDQYGRPIPAFNQPGQHQPQQPYHQHPQQQQQQQTPMAAPYISNNSPHRMSGGAPDAQPPVNASPKSKVALDKALPAAPDKTERDAGSRWKGLRSKMTEQMNNMSQGMSSKEDKPDKGDRNSGKKLMDAFKRGSKQSQSDVPVASPGKPTPGYYNHYIAPGESAGPPQSQSQPMSPHEQMYVVTPQQRMSAQNNYFPPQPSARSSTGAGFQGSQAPGGQGTLVDQMRQPHGHRDTEQLARTDPRASQTLAARPDSNVPSAQISQNSSPQPRHSGYSQPLHAPKEPSPESQRDAQYSPPPAQSPGVRMVQDEQSKVVSPVQQQPVGTGHEEPEDVIVTPMSAFPKSAATVEPAKEAKRASVASKPTEPSPIVENAKASSAVAGSAAAAAAAASVAAASAPKESALTIELEDTADARQRTIRLESQEEKIAYDPLDAEPVMAATSYPGQEWNPYGDSGFGDWTED